jgi:CDGSH-type Zn-finger protein/uncharacterized Fe-S cluster protein YjdI
MRAPTREQLIHHLYEAAELEHNLMCTYLYAAFSLKSGEAEGLTPREAAAVARWRSAIRSVAIEEMGHLTAVWNITAALGGSPRFGRGNFPLDPGQLPASVVVKLAPFSDDALQHFVHLERPTQSEEPDGAGFAPELSFTRGVDRPRITPMPLDYETVGAFYESLGVGLRAFVEHHGEADAFCGDPALQLSASDVELVGTKPVICSKTALAAFTAIVEQGEGAPGHSVESHFQRFCDIREELAALQAENSGFRPAFPSAHNPVLRRPLNAATRVWIEDEDAARIVDLANTGYQLMLRLLAYSYVVPRPLPDKRLAVDLALGVMRAVTHLAESAARRPAGPSHPTCNAGVSFTVLRDAAPLVRGPSAARFFIERIREMVEVAAQLDADDPRIQSAARILDDLAKRAARGFTAAVTTETPRAVAPPIAPAAPRSEKRDGVEQVEGAKLTLLFDDRKCIHSRFCVTGAPNVFIANAKGPWIHPDAMEVDSLVEIAHACPSGAIRYLRKDGRPDEAPPPVNLITIREAGPYAVRAELRIDGEPAHFRATLCRCGASKNKPYCDSSHRTIEFAATGEPKTVSTDMLEARNGPLEIDPQIDGPLQVRGNLEIVSGTGRIVARVTRAKLCRCGASNTKPFCDNSHQRIGFRSDR